MDLKMNKMIAIANTFDEEGLVYRTSSIGMLEDLTIEIPILNGPPLSVVFIGRDDREIHMRVLHMLSVAKEKEPSVLKVCNQLNAAFMYAKFVLTDDGSVNIEYDFPMEVKAEEMGPCAYELLIRIATIMSECGYGMLMRALYEEDVLMDDSFSLLKDGEFFHN